jgi:hypothetical protein
LSATGQPTIQVLVSYAVELHKWSLESNQAEPSLLEELPSREDPFEGAVDMIVEFEVW